MYELLWLLLPVAAGSGWWMAKRDERRHRAANAPPVNPDYIKGLNYLLNEQTDKAIELFVHMLEVNSETVETHLALGHLFRRRGEVDRAIRIHQNLIARPTLSREQRTQALLALGEDYMRAGLLDRAESLFLELVELEPEGQAAIKHLLDIYQQEREWDKAIAMAQRLAAGPDVAISSIIAQFYCELADQAREQHDQALAVLMLKRALAADERCVRATLMRGDLYRAQGKYEEALAAYAQVAEQDLALLPEVLDAQLDCYRELGRLPEFIRLLRQQLSRYAGVQPLIMLADLMTRQGQADEARKLVLDELERRPSLRALQWLGRQGDGVTVDGQRISERVVETLAGLDIEAPAYLCGKCGFSGHAMHWRCPGCKRWNSIKPLPGLLNGLPVSAAATDKPH